MNNPKKYTSGIFTGIGALETAEINSRPLKSHEVGIKNMAAGICGTDIHIYNGEKGSAEVHPPIVLGHEYSGIVVEVGAEVTTLNVGDHVTIDPNIYCGICPYCRSGKKHLCGNLQAVGVTQDGGFAEYSIVPEAQALRVDESVAFEDAALLEPLACCIHGMDIASVKHGDTVLIIGAGAIGLIMLQLARLGGASCVIVSEPSEKRRRSAMELGADYVLNPIVESPADILNERTERGGADVVIECAGASKAAEQAFQAAAKGASILLFSVPSPDASFSLPLYDVFGKELRIFGSFINPDTHLRAIELLNTGRIKLKELISHRYPLERIDEALKMASSPESVKVVVLPNR